MKKLLLTATALLFVLFAAFVSLYLDLTLWAGHPLGTDRTVRTVTVPAGQRFGATAEELRRVGLVDRPYRLRLLARLRGDDRRIKAGEYLLDATMSPDRILAVLKQGRQALHRLTVPEGFNLRQIADLVAEKGFGDSERFHALATDAAFLAEEGLPGDSFEGYLFPDTYHLPRRISPERIIRVMVRRFRAVFTPEWRQRAQALGFSVHQIVTLASIIEKETAVDGERPLVASVFHNRLRRRMRLEADPTVIYGISGFDGDLTRKDLRTPTPYNTYVIRGLPPGPIASPGYASLQAALYPAETQFLYFVARRDSTHQFSGTLREHRRAVKKYQLGAGR